MTKWMLTRGEKLRVNTRYGRLSRGKCWGKLYRDKTSAMGDFEWVAKDGGDLLVDAAGYLVYGSDDGFSRKEKSTALIIWRPEPAVCVSVEPSMASLSGEAD